MAQTEPALSIAWELLGEQRGNVQSYQLDTSFTSPTDSFSFELWDQDPAKLTGLDLQPVTLSLHGHQQLKGRVDVTECGGSDGSTIRCSGRDYIADLAECDVDPTVKLTKDMTLSAALLLAAGPCGIDTVVGDDEVMLRNIRTGVSIGGAQPGADFKQAKLEDYKPDDNERVLAFCQSLVARHGATVQPGADRNQLAVAAPNYQQGAMCELRRLRDPVKSASNTIKNSSARRDLSGFPSFVLFVGKQGRVGKTRNPMKVEQPFAFSDGALDKHITDQLVTIERQLPADGPKSAPGLYRLFYRRDSDSKNEAQLMKAMLRAVAERFKDTLLYQCEVQGHLAPDGGVYAPDTMIKVHDEVCNVFETLWVEAVSHRYDSGPSTALTMRRVSSYVY